MSFGEYMQMRWIEFAISIAFIVVVALPLLWWKARRDKRRG